MKIFFLLGLWLGMASRPAPAQIEPERLIPETLHYRLTSGAAEVGNARVTLSRDSVAGIIHIVESISGLFEQTASVTLRAGPSLQSLTSHVVVSRDRHDCEMQLHYDGTRKRITGAVQQPASLGGSHAIDAELMEGAVDLYALPQLLRATPLAVHQTLQFPVFQARQNRNALARVWVTRIETVTVPAGTFECYRVEVFIENARWVLNIAVQSPYRIIRQIHPELQVQFELCEK